MTPNPINHSGNTCDLQPAVNTGTVLKNPNPIYTEEDLFRVLYSAFFADAALSRPSKALKFLDEARRYRMHEENPWTIGEINLVAGLVLPFRSLDIHDFALMTVIVRYLSQGADIKYMKKYWERAEQLRPQMSAEQQALFDELKRECFSK